MGLRIAVFTDGWLPSVDGVTASILSFNGELERRGHHVHVFAPGDAWSHTPGETRYKGYTMWNYPINLWPGGHHTTDLLRGGRFDVVHVQGFGPVSLRGIRAARRVGLPLVLSYHTYLPDLAAYVAPPFLHATARPWAWGVTRYLMRQADLVLAPGPSIAAEILANVPEDELPPIAVQPTGVDVARFHQSARSEALRRGLAPVGGRIVLSVGRLAREKNLEVLVRAFARAHRVDPGLVLVIGGRGQERPRLEDLAGRLGVRGAVRFVGFVADERLPALYASADVFASASSFETQGITALEAMACGTPVVAAKARGLADFVQHERTGLHFPPGDEAAAARALVAVAQDPARFRMAARRQAVRHSVTRMTQVLEDHYRSVLGGRVWAQARAPAVVEASNPA